MAPWSPFGPYVSTTPMLSLRPSKTLTGNRCTGVSSVPKKELTDAELAQLTDVDFSRVVALLVTKQTGEGEVLMGGGRYAADNRRFRQAEIAFVTDGNYRGLGIASHILRHLVRIAQDSGRGALRGGCARGEPVDACCLSEKRPADAAWARRRRSPRNSCAATRVIVGVAMEGIAALRACLLMAPSRQAANVAKCRIFSSQRGEEP